MNLDNSNSTERYALFLIDPAARKCFVHREHDGIALPTLGIPPYTRPAAELTEAVRKEWGLSAVVIDWLRSSGGVLAYAVLEVLASGDAAASQLEAILFDDLTDVEIPVTTLAEVRELLGGRKEHTGPFARFGWLREAEDWLADSLKSGPIRIREVRQLNASSTFALIRFELSSGKAYWLKATGAPNEHEFRTTAYLANRYPDFLPPVLAMRSDWNAWLMSECGTSLHSSESFEDFKAAASTLARLQIETVGTADAMLAAGFGDHRAITLASHIDALVEFLDEAMQRQTSTKVAPLSTTKLRQLGTFLHRACEAVSKLGIPDCVMHGDISPGSVLSDGSRYVFTDWCEAYVGNPFITLEQFCVHTDRITVMSWREELRVAYRLQWKDLLSETEIDNTLKLVPLLSVLSYLYGHGDWLRTSRREEPSLQSYSRGLARRMDRIIADPLLEEAL